MDTVLREVFFDELADGWELVYVLLQHCSPAPDLDLSPRAAGRQCQPLSGCGLTENQGEALGLGFEAALGKHEEEGLLCAEKSAPGDNQGQVA